MKILSSFPFSPLLSFNPQAERARKNAENELGETSARLTEVQLQVTVLTNDKRRMEADIAAMQSDLDDALNAQRAAEERADRLQAEVNRLAGELHQEQENYKNAEALRKQLEIEIREITVRLEEAEAFATREGKRQIAKLQARVSIGLGWYTCTITSQRWILFWKRRIYVQSVSFTFFQ